MNLRPLHGPDFHDGDPTCECTGKQRMSVQLSTERLNLYEGSVRSSKTICSLIRWLQFVRTAPAGNLAMIGRTERTLRRNVVDVLVEILGPKRCKANWGDGELMLLGRRIYLAGASNEAAVGKIQGLTLAGAYVDEATLMPESMWAMLLSRLSVEGAQLFGSMNPEGPNHWMMRDYLKRPKVWVRHDGTVERSDDGERVALGLARFSFRLRDNPSLPEPYLASLEASYSGLWRLRYIEGLWVLAEGAIYDSFDPTPGHGHVILPGQLPELLRFVLAIDYGTTNPFVALLLAEGADERLYVTREWRWDSRAERSQKTDAQYAAGLLQWLDGVSQFPGFAAAREPEYVFVDPSAASFVTQLWHDGWQGVHGADNAVDDGLREVSTLLAADRLKIVAGPFATANRAGTGCDGLIDEKAGYVWDPKAAAKGEDAPLKVNDHGPDAERYGVRGTRRWWRHWIAGALAEAA